MGKMIQNPQSEAKHLKHPLVAGCRIWHKPLPPCVSRVVESSTSDTLYLYLLSICGVLLPLLLSAPALYINSMPTQVHM